MKSRKLILVLATALLLACLWQLVFTVVSNNVESRIERETNGNPIEAQRYRDSIAEEVVFNLGFVKYTFNEVREKKLNLGLDLQGGMNVVMEVAVDELIRATSGFSNDSSFNKAIRRTAELQANSDEEYVTSFAKAYKEVNPGMPLSRPFATRANQKYINSSSTDAEVEKFLSDRATEAIDQSLIILRNRIDKFGVVQPNIKRQQGSGRIIIELAGVDNPERVRKLLQGTAKLEFWETYEAGEVLNGLFDFNKRLGDKYRLQVGLDTATAADNDATKPIATTNSDSLEDDLAMSDTSTKLSKDSIEANLSPDEQKKLNPLFSVMYPAIGQNDKGQQIIMQGAAVGYALPKDTAEVNRILALPEARLHLPKDLKLLWTVKPSQKESKALELIAIKITSPDRRAPLEGDVIVDARADIDQYRRVEVTMQMNPEGGREWKKLTAKSAPQGNGQKGRSIAIVLDNFVYSYPTVNSEISGGRSSITGNFSVEEAKDLANVLKAGKLPAPARIIEEQVVGPTLGEEAISSGLMSTAGGLLIVLLFMIYYYRKAGLVANFALVTNIILIFGTLASLNAVLTLPGIAGIVLTIGMSVDANVLIYERIKEELKKGKSVKQAIQDGYWHAYSSIIDANVTTFITAVILLLFGTGPIAGFATTLIVGILTSLFCAIFITRLIFEFMLGKSKDINFSAEKSEGWFANATYAITKKRKMFYAFSIGFIALGMGSLVMQGLNYGVDFKGGRSYTIQLPNKANSEQIRQSLNKLFETSPEVKTVAGSDNRFKIATSYLVDEKSIEADSLVALKLFTGLQSFLGSTTSDEFYKSNKFIIESKKVGPTIADDIKRSALNSTIVAIIAIFLYLLIRFRKWEYSLGASLAVFHDVLVIISVFSLFYTIMPFPLEVDQNFIAALLTIVGYSINDTVVVFDRLREYLNESNSDDSEEVINNAINSTLSRTVITAVTTIFVVVVLFIFGGEAIKGFSFALLIGLVVGTYSSIGIAASVVIDFRKKKAAEIAE